MSNERDSSNGIAPVSRNSSGHPATRAGGLSPDLEAATRGIVHGGFALFNAIARGEVPYKQARAMTAAGEMVLRGVTTIGEYGSGGTVIPVAELPPASAEAVSGNLKPARKPKR
jgi:hypothetical protein